MGESSDMDQNGHPEDQMMPKGDYISQRCQRRRNAMGNIFQDVGEDEEKVLEKLAEIVQQLALDNNAQETPGLSETCSGTPQPSSSYSSSSSSSLPSAPSCHGSRLQRSCSATDGEEMRAALFLQNRHRRNAVGNLLDLLSLSQKLLLVDHLQGHMQDQHRLLQAEDSTTQAGVCSMVDLPSSSSSSSSNGSSPRSQGEIVCR